MALNFNQYATEGNAFLKDYAKEMNMPNDRNKAGRVFTSIMHALRDIIPTEESLQLISQLPMFLKAIYVNGWSIKKEKPKVKNMAEFLDLVRAHDWPAAINDFEYSDEVAEQYVDTTFIYLRKYISLGEMEDIRDSLPKDLKSMIYSNLMF
ncbi:Uncharacterized conserved protein, DUF2267 family [Maribacter orientalis]|uniref:Uncharacterized conserved protein, DUF2267 family n=1 Tax=Maribacter orientalis TaxID=228957 RepID=A0A1H7NSL6_9FLAO|nr:DUF2267 domain-containing protein [Maribacter orientalis]SEL26543.1 Uncharacterized conserved protein, DUF2267 family [Maribacter orientalis]|tara:strand:- start:18 stop:470 length:453 start_codon:yes stop_codon:yes gene_type:complete